MMKKLFVLIGLLLLLTAVVAQERTVQVLMPETTNLAAGDTAWLPGMVQDKLKSNLQDYLGMKILIDSSIEKQIKKVQQEAEDTSRDEASAIELGKISTAKFSLFSKILKTNSGYSLSVNYVDNTSGAQIATSLSKTYLKSDSLFGSTGAVDEITVALADKLNIQLSDLQKKKLSQSSEGFTLDEELAISKQNDEQYKKMMKEYDEDLAKLMQSNDLVAIENKKRIEADKALLVEKQNSEKKRLQELEEQKKRNEQDAKLEAERSIALKTQRDKMAKEAADKAAEVRKLKLEKQGVLGQINVLEAKKKALVEIRQGVEERCKELYSQFIIDVDDQEENILNAAWSNVELKDGKPIEAAIIRRQKKVKDNYSLLLNKFYQNCEATKQSTMVQQTALLSEINTDILNLSKTKTVTSLGDELKVSYGTYNSENYGWNAYYSLYSDGILIYQDSFVLKYEALAGKPAPKLETATDAQLDEYNASTDMYNSLLVRGDPILYFEIDYSVKSAKENEPSKYIFDFSKIRVINTVSSKTVQTIILNKKVERKMPVQYDLREIEGIKKQVELSEALKTAESLRQYLKNNIKNVITIDIGKLETAIRNANEETFFIVSGDTRSNRYTFPETLKDISVPIHLDFSDFISIGYEFREIKSIKTIILPEHAKSIDCYDCTSLTNVYIPDSVGFIKFSDCESLTSIHIPDSVTEIGAFAFNRCTSLTSITIPNSVTAIGDYAFDGCTSLKTIKIPKSITKIPHRCFYKCTSLTSITIPNSVTEIESDAFYRCDSLTTINISKKLYREIIKNKIFDYDLERKLKPY